MIHEHLYEPDKTMMIRLHANRFDLLSFSINCERRGEKLLLYRWIVFVYAEPLFNCYIDSCCWCFCLFISFDTKYNSFTAPHVHIIKPLR